MRNGHSECVHCKETMLRVCGSLLKCVVELNALLHCCHCLQEMRRRQVGIRLGTNRRDGETAHVSLK